MSSLYNAVCYTLNRIQTDPDFAYHMVGTQAFELLVKAEAEHLGKSFDEVKESRLRDLQPQHDKRRAEHEVMRELLDELDEDWRQKVRDRQVVR